MIVSKKILHSSWTHITLLFGLLIITYGHTLDVPMYLDDLPVLRDSPRLRDLYDFQAINGMAYLRFLGNLTFAANYHVHGLDVTGYHIVNILIHSFTTIIVFNISKVILRTTPIATYVGEREIIWFPLVVALLFALNPIQTQAVTYIVQRLASLAALFFLLSTLAYI